MLNKKVFSSLLMVAMLAGTIISAAAQNGLTNGNFEAGTANWFSFPASVVPTVETTGAQEGSQCGKVVYPGGTSGAFLQQKIWGAMNIKGKTLRLSGWVKTSFGAGGTPSVSLGKAVKVANVWEDLTTMDVRAGEQASWTHLQGTFTLLSGPTVDPGTTNNTDFLSPRFYADTTGVTGDSTVWWDDAMLVEVTADPSNVLNNGGFELGLDGTWIQLGGTMSIAATGAKEGSQCLQVDVPAGAWGNIVDTYTGPLIVTGKKLLLSAWVKTNFGAGSNPATYLRAHEYDTDGGNLSYGANDSIVTGPIAAWTQLKVAYTSKGNGALPGAGYTYIGLVNDCSGLTGASQIFWDDVRLEEIEDTNILNNGGFEMGTSGWDMYYAPGATIETTGAKEGAQCLKVVTPAGGATRPIIAYSGPKFAPGMTMHISAWVKTQFGAGGTPSVSLNRHEWNEPGASVYVWNGVSDQRFGEQATWTQLHGLFPVAAPVPGKLIWLMPWTDTTGVSGDSITWWDDVRMEEYATDPINQLLNPGFELSTAGWYQYPYAFSMSAVADAAAHEGGNVLKVVYPAGTAGAVRQAYAGPLFYTGCKLRVWAWVKANYPSSGGYVALYKDALIGGAWGNDFANMVQIDGNLSEWTQINAYTTCNAGPANQGDAPVPGDYLEIRLSGDATAVTGGDSTIYWDDAMLAEPYLVPVELSTFSAE